MAAADAVLVGAESARVRGIYDAMVPRYDPMNAVAALGLHPGQRPRP